jgi:hypothetical protein
MMHDGLDYPLSDSPTSNGGDSADGQDVPLAVDLDGTLVQTDVIIESLFLLAKR